ncbi:hypothetical protein BDW02DRAFT_469677, partial [Decorospora gaudefroyi]
QATGVWPMDADAVLKRFNNHTSEQDKASELRQHGDGDSWRELRKFLDAAVPGVSKVRQDQIKASFFSLHVQNELLHHENQGLQDNASTKTKQQTNRTTLTTQEGDEWHGGAIFMSPRKVRTTRARKAAEEDEAEQLRLQKTHDRELKAAVTAYKKKQAEAAKLAQQHAAEERRKAKRARAAQLAAQRALNKQQRDAATAEKSRNTPNNSKRKASHKASQNPTKRRRVVAASSQADAGPPAASPP